MSTRREASFAQLGQTVVTNDSGCQFSFAERLFHWSAVQTMKSEFQLRTRTDWTRAVRREHGRRPGGARIEVGAGGAEPLPMRTALRSAVENYLRARSPARGTQDEYRTTLKKVA